MGTPFGFPDWQNQRPLDGPLLLDLNAVAALQSNVFGPVYVGRWARIGGDAFLSAQPALWTFTWYADQAATKVTGTRKIVTDSLVLDSCFFMLPNLGPWLKVSYAQPAPAPASNITHHLFGTNREPPLDVSPPGPVSLISTPIAVASGATVTTYFTDYYAGPAHLWLTRSAAATVSLEAAFANNAYAQVAQWLLAGAQELHQDVVIPPSACRLKVQDTGASLGNVSVAIVPAYTGG